ncbi:hypothetical protein AB0J72_25340 [Dactylosporangium sp. NPDC049742]|uniref:hypothetical protein n=1 Tax=Dactylosporangium sp. NPDC049742 TaxID=3154737 RepID=UPI00343AC5B0
MTAVTDRNCYVEPGRAELLFEIAVTLLPLIGRCVELVGGEPVTQHGNRLGTAEDRRIVIADIARQWNELDAGTRARFAPDWQAAVAAFTVDYVDMVEMDAPGPRVYEHRRYEVAMALIWHQHARRLSARSTSQGPGPVTGGWSGEGRPSASDRALRPR